MNDPEQSARFANTFYHWLESPETVAALRALQAGLDTLYQGAPTGTTAHLPPVGQRIETEDCDAFRGFHEGLSLAVEGAVADLLRRRRRPIAIPAHARGKEAALAGPLDAAMESLYDAAKRALAAARSGVEA